MRVFEALLLLPDLTVELRLDVGADFFERGLLRYEFAVLDDVFLQLARRAVREEAVLPRLLGVDVAIGLRHVGRLVGERQEVGDGVAFCVVDAVDLFPAGVRDLLDRFGDFDFRENLAVLFHGGELVDRAEDRLALRRDQAFAHAEAVDLAALRVEDRGDRILVETVRGDDLAVGKPRRVEHGAHALRQVGEVARVDAHALEPFAQRIEHVLGGANGVRNARVYDVVGIDEEDGIVGVRLGILLECRVFVVIVHDPAVRHRAADGDAEELTREHRRRRGRAADVGGACAVDGGVDVVCAACAEVGNDAPACRPHDAARLRRDERLVVDLGEERRLDELRVDDGRGHGEDRLFGVHDRAFAKRADVACEAVVREVVEEVFVEERERAQVVDVSRREVHRLDVLNDLLKPREDGKAAAVGVAAEEDVEGGACFPSLLALAEIAVGHRQLVEIHHHRDVA